MWKSLLVNLLILSALLTHSAYASSSDYKLGAGDEIEIKVFGQDDLYLKTLLSSDGRINFRFLGEITAVGVTKADLERTIVSGLKGDYLIDPNVSINIVSYRNFYIHGEVEKPGGYPFEPGLDINKAISLAGGLTERASKQKILLIKEGSNANEPQTVTLSTKIGPGDTITIDKRFF